MIHLLKIPFGTMVSFFSQQMKSKLFVLFTLLTVCMVWAGDPTLEAWWSFESIGSDFVFYDATANKRDLITMNRPDNCIRYNGPFGKYIKISSRQVELDVRNSVNVFNYPNFTVTAFVLLTSSTESQTIFQSSAVVKGAIGGYRLQITPQRKVRLTLGNTQNGWQIFESAGSVRNNIVTHIAASFDGTNVHLYLNGVIDQTLSCSAGYSSIGGSAAVGRSVVDGDNEDVFQGCIDEIKVYSRALDIDDLRAAANPKVDNDFDGYTPEQGDTDDSNPAINPAAPEVCDGIDNDCDWLIDEECPPLIITQPVSSSVRSGENAGFSVQILGAEPMTYQWNKDGIAIAGATQSNFTIAHAYAGDSGNYSVSISNTLGSVESNQATLTVVGFVPPGAILFSDDFNDGSMKPEWVSVMPNQWIETGWLHCQDRNGGPRDAMALVHDADSSWTDYEVTMDVDPVEGSSSWQHANILLRTNNFIRASGVSRGQAYQLDFYGSGFSESNIIFSRVNQDNQEYVELVRIPHTPPSEQFTVRIQAIAGHFTAWINDIQIFEVTDPNPYLSGGIGVHTIWESEARFDNVVVRSLGNPGGLVLWNKLGSEADILNSEAGPAGRIKSGGNFVSGMFGNAWEISMQMDTIINFPASALPGDSGCIEFWARLRNLNSGTIPWGGSPLFIYYASRTSPVTYILHLNSNDGGGLGGVCGLVSAVSDIRCGTGTYGSYRYDQILGTGQVESWHHYALVWDRNGLPGGQQINVYVDGVVATNAHYGYPPHGMYANPNEWFGLMYNNNKSIDGFVAYDNLKIWNYAKTDFSDRFSE